MVFLVLYGERRLAFVIIYNFTRYKNQYLKPYSCCSSTFFFPSLLQLLHLSSSKENLLRKCFFFFPKLLNFEVDLVTVFGNLSMEKKPIALIKATTQVFCSKSLSHTPKNHRHIGNHSGTYLLAIFLDKFSLFFF